MTIGNQAVWNVCQNLTDYGVKGSEATRFSDLSATFTKRHRSHVWTSFALSLPVSVSLLVCHQGREKGPFCTLQLLTLPF